VIDDSGLDRCEGWREQHVPFVFDDDRGNNKADKDFDPKLSKIQIADSSGQRQIRPPA